jgi:hypothetical protein
MATVSKCRSNSGAIRRSDGFERREPGFPFFVMHHGERIDEGPEKSDHRAAIFELQILEHQVSDELPVGKQRREAVGDCRPGRRAIDEQRCAPDHRLTIRIGRQRRQLRRRGRALSVWKENGRCRSAGRRPPKVTK